MSEHTAFDETEYQRRRRELAEDDRLFAERRKFYAEADKLQAERRNFDRQTFVVITQAVTAGAALFGAGAAFGAFLLSLLRH